MTTKNKMSYENGKIYKIIGTDPNDKCYVGSTTKQYLSQRMTKHKANYKLWKGGKLANKTYSFEMFDKYGADNCSIILLEKCNVTSKDELRAREQHYIDNLECINRNCAFLDTERKAKYQKEYNDRNKESLAERKKVLYQLNKDQIIARNKKYAEENKEKRKATVQQWRINNKDIIQAKQKRYTEENKEKIKIRQNTKVLCQVCNCEMSKSNVSCHNKSKKHVANSAV